MGRQNAGPPLGALNFFLADVRDGLGPYLAIYLLAVHHWDEASIGAVLTVGGIAAILAQTPAGALIDRTRAKRALIVAAAIAVTASSLAVPFLSGFWPIAATQAVTGVAGAVFPPAIAALTLGIVGLRGFARQVGRNEAFNHAGNASAAVLAGATAYVVGPIAVFWLMAGMALASLVAVLRIPAKAIDHDRARGLDGRLDPSRMSGSAWRVLLGCRPLLVFAVCTTLFHFANAAMLPLVGQKLALAHRDLATTLTSLCIVAAQAIMVPVAWFVGAKADRWGRKPFFGAALAVLALRGALYPLSDHMAWLVGVQCLDGVGAGIFGALFPLVIADLTQGTGHFNVSQGVVATAQGVGAAASTLVVGFIVVAMGYSAAFLFLAGIAALALGLFWFAMPETAPGFVGSLPLR